MNTPVIEVFDGTHDIRARAVRETHGVQHRDEPPPVDYRVLVIECRAVYRDRKPIGPGAWVPVEDTEARIECMEEILLQLLG